MLVTKSGQLKNAAVELLVIDHQTAVFQVKNFHCGKPLVDENENLSTLDVALHYGSNDGLVCVTIRTRPNAYTNLTNDLKNSVKKRN
jgi:hypothetical protein